MSQVVFAAIVALTLTGADATGTWSGSFTVGDGSGEPRPVTLVLKQDGETLTGTGGPDAARQMPIRKGKVQNGTLTFEIATDDDGVMMFDLKQDAETISGEIWRERDGQKQTAKLSAKRTQ